MVYGFVGIYCVDEYFVLYQGENDMSIKTETEVVIGGKSYTLSGSESAEYLQRVAFYINNKKVKSMGNDILVEGELI